MGLPVVSDTLQSYLVEISRYPVMTAEEEYEVAERYYKFRSIEDAHRLVTSNLRYVVKIALEFRNYGVRLQDLVQEGNIGLMTAVKKFNPYKGFRLITYATWWIRSFIQDYIIRTKGLVRHSTKALKRKLFYRNSPAVKPGEESCEAVAPDAGYIDSVGSPDLSLNAEISGEKTPYIDMIEDGRPGQEEALSEVEEAALVKSEIGRALSLLNERERYVVEKRVMAEEPESLQGLGAELGLTRERVRQIEAQALKKLRKALSAGSESPALALALKGS